MGNSLQVQGKRERVDLSNRALSQTRYYNNINIYIFENTLKR